MNKIWIAQGHANQRDIIQLIRADLPDVPVFASHRDFREDILSCASSYESEPRKVTETEYVDWLLSAAKANGVNAVLAFRNRGAVERRRGEFADSNIAVSTGAISSDNHEIADKKDRFTSLMEASGIPVAKTVTVSTPAQMRSAVNAMKNIGDVCVKPVTGVYAQGFWILSDQKDPLHAYLATDTRISSTNAFLSAYESAEEPIPYLVMEYLPGVEYSVDCVCESGTVIAAASRRKDPTYQVVETGGDQIEIARRVARALNLDGLINIQVRRDAAGEARVLETNARPAGAVGLSAAAGINLPAIWARNMLKLPFQMPKLEAPVAIRQVTNFIQLPETTKRLT